MFIHLISSFAASIGFGILFNIKGKKLLFAAIGGSISWMSYLTFKNLDYSNVLSFFLSAVIFSIYSEIFARILKTPVTTLIVVALIPLVPGTGMYNTMYETVTGDINSASLTAINTIASAGSLALGVIFVSSITRQIAKIKHIKHNHF
ncbi:threonine/serine exporter family protein [Clostridium sp. BJN0001]|uniref:threonine/serine exporter family protein n=1 Tax=Clostridium sp. BJN0001 TaxID=2930219 RepID=UPI001FCF9D65|nr:threonine/serine exporter family protein [Clostridium sp. BJN0001]